VSGNPSYSSVPSSATIVENSPDPEELKRIAWISVERNKMSIGISEEMKAGTEQGRATRGDPK